jgi:lysophospholipase L1-like esterase
LQRHIKKRILTVFVTHLMALSGCGIDARGSGDPAMTSDSINFLALGDSYTIGESVGPTERWPVQLAKALEGEGLPTRDPVIVAQTGWTTDELAMGIEGAGLTGTYDLVTLLIGVNNQYRGRDLGEYRVQFSGLLSRAISFTGGDPGRVLVLSIPDWGVTPFAEGRDRGQIAREIDAFNGAKRLECEAAGAWYLDITGISREATDDPLLVARDGLHPSGSMYALWAEAAMPVALEALRSDSSGPASR